MADSTPKPDERSGVAARVVTSPDLLGGGWRTLAAPLPLSTTTTLLALLLDPRRRPVALIPDETPFEHQLGEALRVRQELFSLAPLLEHLWDARERVHWSDPGALLVGERFSDVERAVLESLADRVLGLEVKGAGEAALTGGVEAPRPREEPVAPEPEKPAQHPGGADPAAEAPGSEEPPGSAAPEPARAPAPKVIELPHNGKGAAREDLLNEAKRKILRISDEVEEEVDGEMVRFLLRDHVLAVLCSRDGQFSLWVGDQLDRRRMITHRDDLNGALDDIFCRYFSLSRTLRATDP